MRSPTLMLEPGTLENRIIEQTELALKCGALQPISTKSEQIEQDGIHFLVRIVSNLTRKDEAKPPEKDTSGKNFNPFLPYEPDLFVGDLSETHLCLLNKFNVVDHHLLIVTRAFEAQEMLLTQQDFEALWVCLAEIEGLGFYNGGAAAGASQRHKHLQLIPLPLVPQTANLPIASGFPSAQFDGAIGKIPQFSFQHALLRFDFAAASPSVAAAATLEGYYALLRAVGLPVDSESPEPRQSGPYNLLITREWMLIIPRLQEKFESISVNSLGFAGALLVRNDAQMNLLKQQGPLTILKNVSMPA